eukprot:8892340-Alexandrium_andersonii.AAC.1
MAAIAHALMEALGDHCRASGARRPLGTVVAPKGRADRSARGARACAGAARPAMGPARSRPPS